MCSRIQMGERSLVVAFTGGRVVLPKMHPIHMVVDERQLPLLQPVPHLRQELRLDGREKSIPDVGCVQRVAIAAGLQIAEDIDLALGQQAMHAESREGDVH